MFRIFLIVLACQTALAQPRVLIIGDSISIGYTPYVQRMLAGTARVEHNAGNAFQTGNGVQRLKEWLGDGKWDVIHFNFGLHDIRVDANNRLLTPIDQYERNLRTIVSRLKATGAKLVWATTTPVPEGVLSPVRRTADALRYDAVARRVMQEAGVAINDLYALALPRSAELQLPLNVHFNEVGSEALAREVADHVRKALGYHRVRVERRVRARMRDGVELATVIVRPDAPGRFPAIMAYNPYRWLSSVKDSYSDAEYNHRFDGPSYFAERGYAVVYFDVRGTGNSGGWSHHIYSDEERKDAYDMVEWIAGQPWCDGGVAMWGMSYGGVVQWQVGVQNPPHLKTLVVGSSNDDVYLDWTYPGGSLRPYMFDAFSPLMTAGNFGPPDPEVTGVGWNDLWRERLEKNVPWGVGFITGQLHGKYWRDRSLQPDYSRIKVPVMLWSGWADCYPTPILRAFSRLQVPKKVFIGPWGHYWPEEAVPGPRIDFRRELLKWYDRWLKGIDTGVLKEPPVALFVRTYKEPESRMYIHDNGLWRHENEWPPARTQAANLYLAANGKLVRDTAEGAAEKDSYRYNPTVGITSGIYWGGGILPYAMPVDQRQDEALSLTYTGEPFASATEITGQPKAILFVSSTADTAYFHVKITDVAPDGTSKWITDGGLRAERRNSHSEPEPLTPGDVYRLGVDLKYMAYVFPAGHRVRVSVASADFQNAWPTAKAATNTIYRGATQASHVVLPLMPRQVPMLPVPALLPSPKPDPKPENAPATEHQITHDLVKGTVTVHLRRSSKLGEDERRAQSWYTVSRANPANAGMRASNEYTLGPANRRIKVEANETLTSDRESFHFLSDVEVTVNGKRHWQKSWQTSVPRR